MFGTCSADSFGSSAATSFSEVPVSPVCDALVSESVTEPETAIMTGAETVFVIVI